MNIGNMVFVALVVTAIIGAAYILWAMTRKLP